VTRIRSHREDEFDSIHAGRSLSRTWSSEWHRRRKQSVTSLSPTSLLLLEGQTCARAVRPCGREQFWLGNEKPAFRAERCHARGLRWPAARSRSSVQMHGCAGERRRSVALQAGSQQKQAFHLASSIVGKGAVACPRATPTSSCIWQRAPCSHAPPKSGPVERFQRALRQDRQEAFCRRRLQAQGPGREEGAPCQPFGDSYASDLSNERWEC
jgi:hypothetical protein